MSNNVNAAAPNTALGGLGQSLDYLSNFGQRALEGFYNYKLLNTELKTRNQMLQWQAAANNQLYGQMTGDGSSPYGVGGVNAIPSARNPGYASAGIAGLGISNIGIAAAIGLALAFAFFKK